MDKDWRQSLREDREAFILADELGYVEGYVGEHATDQAENITSCVMFICTLIEATKRIKLGTGTINMPNSHPAAVASQIAMLDHLLDGRFIFGISPGGLMSDAEAFGNLDADRNAMFLECDQPGVGDLEQRAALQHQGQVLERRASNANSMPDIGQGYLPKPLQRPHPPIVVTAVAPFSQGRDRSGRARLGTDLGELPDAGVGEKPLAEIRRRLRARRPPGRSGRTGAWPKASSSRTTTRPRAPMPPIRMGPTATTTASFSPSCGAVAGSICSRAARSA